MKPQIFHFKIEKDEQGLRLDRFLANHLVEFSRQYLQTLIKGQNVQVNGKSAKPRTILQAGDTIELTVPPARSLDLKPYHLPLTIIFENKDIVVVDKPAGLVVHPGQGQSHQDDTLVNALLAHYDGKLSGIGGVKRPGIVHRLDKDTSGLLVIAKNDKAHHALAKQLERHEMEKIYFTLVAGRLEPQQGSIDAPIGRSSFHRQKMAVVQSAQGKQALTHYQVLQTFLTNFAVGKQYSLVRVRIVTGRTHQIRVHFSSIDFPVVGDALYGREKINHFFEREFGLTRQFLHAAELTLVLPGTKKKRTFRSSLPQDLQKVLAQAFKP